MLKTGLCLLMAGCSGPGTNETAPKITGPGPTEDTTGKKADSTVSNTLLEDYVMDGYDTTKFTEAFNEEGIEMRVREIGYQHGHTIYAMALNLYRDDKMIFTDTIPFYPDPSEYELLHLEDGTPVVKVSGLWANMGASSEQEDFYLIENDSIFILSHVSGYCGGDHYNFDYDSTCLTMFLDAYEFHYTLSRKKGEKHISVIKEGVTMSAEDPCKTGFDTLRILERSVMNTDTLVVYYSEEISARKKKVLVSIPKARAVKQLGYRQK